jgi:hypothetical protein
VQELEKLPFIHTMPEGLAAVHKHDRNLLLEICQGFVIRKDIDFLQLEVMCLLKTPKLLFHFVAQAAIRLGVNNDLIFHSQK